jgi:hypothetical protein
VFVLPITTNLVRENPKIIANQPKGSMSLKVEMRVSGALRDNATQNAEGRIRYSALFVTEKIKKQIVSDLSELKKQYPVERSLQSPTTVDFRSHLRPSAVTSVFNWIVPAKRGEVHRRVLARGTMNMTRICGCTRCSKGI